MTTIAWDMLHMTTTAWGNFVKVPWMWNIGRNLCAFSAESEKGMFLSSIILKACDLHPMTNFASEINNYVWEILGKIELIFSWNRDKPCDWTGTKTHVIKIMPLKTFSSRFQQIMTMVFCQNYSCIKSALFCLWPFRWFQTQMKLLLYSLLGENVYHFINIPHSKNPHLFA